MKRFFAFTSALSLVLIASGVTRSQTRTPSSGDDRALDAGVRAEVAQFKGKVSLFAKNLDTGVSYALDSDNRVRTASTIKVAIMVEAFASVAEGKAKWTDEVVLTNAKKVPGSGVLQDLSDGLKLTLRDAMTLMMTVSDNTATNLVLDVLTTDAVNARMDSLGLKQTRVLRKIGGGGTSKAGEDPALKPFGTGVTTPHEMATLLEKIERGQIINPAACKEMIDLMKREQHRDGIGRAITDTEMATKAGALDRLRSDVGIIYSKQGRVVMAITCDDMPEIIWSEENPGYLMLSRLSRILIEGLGKH
jgi:beta-lactamase class A